VNRKSCIEDLIIENVLRWVQFRELQRGCDCTGAKVGVSQRLKSLRGILVRNSGFSESDFFVVCEDIWIAIWPFFVVVGTNMMKGSQLNHKPHRLQLTKQRSQPTT
jgi:hypothetical protein